MELLDKQVKSLNTFLHPAHPSSPQTLSCAPLAGFIDLPPHTRRHSLSLYCSVQVLSFCFHRRVFLAD
ncbi:hypothetical protein QYF36_018710 [Acer negundo]|nr:hypothetical protein QYF36_018710 [Acer negundo]